MNRASEPGRVIWQLTGADRLRFLQGLVSNDLLPLDRGPGIVWAALLTPQGKYLADFFVLRPEAETGSEPMVLIDIDAALAADTLRRLSMYRLRADVQITPAALGLRRGLGPMPPRALADPRHAALGWRLYAEPARLPPETAVDWDAIRVQHCIPESGIELRPGETYLLEAGFERLHGVDFRKGCYVGQEVTARMKHKTELKKGLVTVEVEGCAPVGTPILSGEREAGVLYTQSGGRGIAYLRHDRTEALTAGSAKIRVQHGIGGGDL